MTISKERYDELIQGYRRISDVQRCPGGQGDDFRGKDP